MAKADTINRRRWKALLALVIIAAVGWWLWGKYAAHGATDKKAAMAIPVEGLAATQGRIAETLTVSGQAEALHGAELRAEIAGRVTATPVKDGSEVKQGDILINLDDSVLKAQLAQAQANLAVSENTAARNQRLLAAGAASKQEAENATAQAKLARANVQLAQANLDKVHIAAPFDGVVGVGQVNLGDYVSPGTLLTTVTEPTHLKVLFRLPEDQALTARVGTPVTVTTGTATAPGEIAAIDGQIDPATRTVQARVDIDNTSRTLVPGQFVRATVDVRAADDAVLIPDMSIVQQGDNVFVFKVRPADASGTTVAVSPTLVASRTTVTLGLRNDDMVQITSGVQAGEVVVTAGQQKLQSPVMPVKLLSPTVISVAPALVEHLDPAKAN